MELLEGEWITFEQTETNYELECQNVLTFMVIIITTVLRRMKNGWCSSFSGILRAYTVSKFQYPLSRYLVMQLDPVHLVSVLAAAVIDVSDYYP